LGKGDQKSIIRHILPLQPILSYLEKGRVLEELTVSEIIWIFNSNIISSNWRAI